jgi:hypothetical protein
MLVLRKYRAMLSTIIYFALLQVVCGLPHGVQRSTSDNNLARSAPLQSRDIDTSVKVALGLTIPGAALVIGLAIVIIWFYPAQLRKLRKENPGAEIGLAELMNGRVTERPAPPVYTEHHPSTVNDTPSHPTPRYEATPVPAYEADARHTALRLG